MARSVQEGDQALVLFDLVGSDVLGDATRFLGGDVGFTDRIQQGSFAVVDMAHDGDHRRSRRDVLRLFLGNGFILCVFLETDDRGFRAEIRAQVLGQSLVQRLVHGGEDALVQQPLDQILGFDFQPFGQLLDGDALGQGDGAIDGNRLEGFGPGRGRRLPCTESAVPRLMPPAMTPLARPAPSVVPGRRAWTGRAPGKRGQRPALRREAGRRPGSRGQAERPGRCSLPGPGKKRPGPDLARSGKVLADRFGRRRALYARGLPGRRNRAGRWARSGAPRLQFGGRL